MGVVIAIAVIVILVIILTGKHRRADIINNEIIQLINSGRKNIILRDVYYEAALKYAIEHGADTHSSINDNIDDSIHFLMEIGNINYFICFSRHIDGSTYLGINDADEAQRQFRARINK